MQQQDVGRDLSPPSPIMRFKKCIRHLDGRSCAIHRAGGWGNTHIDFLISIIGPRNLHQHLVQVPHQLLNLTQAPLCQFYIL